MSKVLFGFLTPEEKAYIEQQIIIEKTERSKRKLTNDQ